MSGLLYREDMDEVRRRLTDWWNGGDLGRPALQVSARREKPLEDIPELPMPEGCRCPVYTTMDFDFRVNWDRRRPVNTHYLAEAVPSISPDLAPNCLALFLGCPGVEGEGTVWCEPIIDPDNPESAVFEVREDNKYLDFSLRLGRELKRLGEGKFLLEFPDFIEGLDTLAAMRDTQRLLFDLVERPGWVHESLAKITECWRRVYDMYYEFMADEVGGSSFWAWAPGKMVKLQCDISAMLGPEMFGEFMMPVLEDLTRFTDYSMYHWDGPGALPHLDHLLNLEALDMIQWTPGSGAPSLAHPQWFPMYHRIVEAGKKVILLGIPTDSMPLMKKEFGRKLQHFMINLSFDSLTDAEEGIKQAQY